MKKENSHPRFLNVGRQLLEWYDANSRDLPWRKTKMPYHVWISEIILQQTQVKQGTNHYINFIERFPDVKTLYEASIDEVLLYWKGLGYYSRAINLHKAAHQIMEDLEGIFPRDYNELLKLRGIGKYTAAAISSICFNEKIPAIDGNFYRVLSRFFADDYDISKSDALNYFQNIAMMIMPNERYGDFNQAIMDLGSEVCKPKNPNCNSCPLSKDCLAFLQEKAFLYPRKTKKIKTENLQIDYYFIFFEDRFLVKQRGEDFIWKLLFDFPENINESYLSLISDEVIIKHKLTHKNLLIKIKDIEIKDERLFNRITKELLCQVIGYEDSLGKSFPKALENYLKSRFDSIN